MPPSFRVLISFAVSSPLPSEASAKAYAACASFLVWAKFRPVVIMPLIKSKALSWFPPFFSTSSSAKSLICCAPSVAIHAADLLLSSINACLDTRLMFSSSCFLLSIAGLSTVYAAAPPATAAAPNLPIFPILSANPAPCFSSAFSSRIRLRVATAARAKSFCDALPLRAKRLNAACVSIISR